MWIGTEASVGIARGDRGARRVRLKVVQGRRADDPATIAGRLAEGTVS